MTVIAAGSSFETYLSHPGDTCSRVYRRDERRFGIENEDFSRLHSSVMFRYYTAHRRGR